MRVGYALLLIVALLIGGGYWYKSTEYVCPVPLSYGLGELSPEFGITAEEAKAYAESAERVWEQATRRDLFTYDPDADFTVDFIFDERQEFADNEEDARTTLDERKGESEEIFATVDTLQQEFEDLKQTYEDRNADYEVRLKKYNETVGIYNERGGAPEDIFAELEAQRAELDIEVAELTAGATALNELAQQINALREEGSDQIAEYNQRVDRYNDQFGAEREFIQGDYTGDSITIYKFSDENELSTVLVHEFGHALGIDHVDNENAIMYYLLGDTSEAPELTGADLAIFTEVCDTGATWQQYLRTMIRSLL